MEETYYTIEYPCLEHLGRVWRDLGRSLMNLDLAEGFMYGVGGGQTNRSQPHEQKNENKCAFTHQNGG